MKIYWVGVKQQSLTHSLKPLCLLTNWERHNIWRSPQIWPIVTRFMVYGCMAFNATFNNISVTPWWSVSLVEETGENHRPVASHWQSLSHDVVSSTPRQERTLVVIGTDYTGNYKSNYHTITSPRPRWPSIVTKNRSWEFNYIYLPVLNIILAFHFNIYGEPGWLNEIGSCRARVTKWVR